MIDNDASVLFLTGLVPAFDENRAGCAEFPARLGAKPLFQIVECFHHHKRIAIVRKTPRDVTKTHVLDGIDTPKFVLHQTKKRANLFDALARFVDRLVPADALTSRELRAGRFRFVARDALETFQYGFVAFQPVRHLSQVCLICV